MSHIWMMMVFLFAIVVASSVNGQGVKTKDDPKLKPRPVTLKTKDGIELRAFYFPSAKGKEAITVMLVHEWQGKGASPYGKLVKSLRDAGCAVLAPDYRGHGGSTQRTKDKKFNIAQMSKRDVENIIAFDLEKAKGFLKQENNEENLNLNALVLIGIGEGCVMAAHWAQRDWNFPSVGRMKQGQDVKCLVFVSPEKQIKGVAIDPTLGSLVRLPMMVVAGASSPEASEAKRLAKRVEGMKKRIGRGKATGFEFKSVDTSLSGPALVTELSSVISGITEFITNEVVISDDENEWIAR
jgi:pimeloyl-ACP methyl ester carboxylesterase